jgi:hypothetical protein
MKKQRILITVSEGTISRVIKKAITFKRIDSLLCTSNNSEDLVDIKPIKKILGYLPESDYAIYKGN